MLVYQGRMKSTVSNRIDKPIPLGIQGVLFIGVEGLYDIGKLAADRTRERNFYLTALR